MKIDAVDFFYLAMPEVTLEADGSQDALLVRVAAGPFVGYGECEAAPLPSIAAFVCPQSHGACQPVSASVLDRELNDTHDIAAIAADVAYNSMDVLQAAHTFSGIEMALWDILGKARGEPVWKLLGYTKSHAKTPYASLLFGDDAQQTLQRARDAVASLTRAVEPARGGVKVSTLVADSGIKRALKDLRSATKSYVERANVAGVNEPTSRAFADAVAAADDAETIRLVVQRLSLIHI